MPVIISSLNKVYANFYSFKPEAIISIVDPYIENPEFNNKIPVLNLQFNDICFELESEYDKRKYSPPNRNHIDDILHFGAVTCNKNTRILTHCFAGISRSSAAAIIALCPLYGYLDAVDIVANADLTIDDKIFKGSEYFMPNNLMIKYADDRLCLNGDLCKLVDKKFIY